MKIGTKSLLFGAHQFLLHPLMLARAWWMLYGFPFDPRLWVAFFVHDIGYWGKPNMDGPEGETHPELGAKIMGRLFGYDWYYFTLTHSRFYASSHGMRVSRLCAADKLATAITPIWLYLALVRASGEIVEYRNPPKTRYEATYTEQIRKVCSDYEWVVALKSYMKFQVPSLKDEAATRGSNG